MSIPGERYFKLSNAIFCYHLTPIQLSVYSYLVSCAGQKEKCWPSMKTIAVNCSCSENAARTAMTKLVELGFISRTRRYRDRPGGRSSQTSNLYSILELPPLPRHPPSDGVPSPQEVEGI